MAWFRNKNTGVTWYVTDPEHVRRLAASADYEEVKKEGGRRGSKRGKSAAKDTGDSE